MSGTCGKSKGGNTMSSEHSWDDVNNVITEVQQAMIIRDSIPSQFKASYDLIQEMNNDMYVKCDKINAMIKDIVCNGAWKSDIPF